MPERALVTGASAGLGAALARRLAARGIEVWLAARRAERLSEHVEEIQKAGGRAHAFPLDVSDAAACAAAVEKLDDESGGLDLVVANAGIGGGGRLVSQTSWENVRDVFNTNVIGALATLLPVVPRMLSRGRGHIVGVSSMHAELPLPAAADYGASKAALTFFLESAQGELPAKGVDVTIIHPGFVKTDLTAKNKFPMPFVLEADEAARIMDDGIARRAKTVRFPLGLVALMGVGKAAPKAWKNAVVSRSLPS